MAEKFADIVRKEGIAPLPLIHDTLPVQKNTLSSVLAPDAGNEDAYVDKHEFLRNGVDARRLRKLLRQAPTMVIDLHGKTAKEAHEALDLFITTALNTGERHLEIIHGRGLHNAEGRAVLRDKVRKWLCKTPHILGYASPNDNAGAVRVLLRYSER
ncbi:Smr/MutS family protein [Candidatus Persebacteraceae bacterium Df01]|uniref:Smr/MutS family protein n=1 Tax=Candidatus Doriopsillibacter californiensis TaxID=2970740 RepID=A0ABT7QMX4_9GAMM|nr:Smr/MutS family protein [Candidatus Persebacteraceae bacterium Df01]